MKKLGAVDRRDGWYEISPADAVTLLAGKLKNRPVSEHQVWIYAEDIRKRNWVSNGESVVMSHDGRLLDGQHRMLAIISADKPLMTYVVFLPERISASAFDTMNQGRKRSVADRLFMEDVKNTSIVASVLRLAVNEERGSERGAMTGGNRIGPAAGRKYFLQHAQEVIDVSYLVGSKRTEIKGWLRIAHLGFVMLHAKRYDPVKAQEWFDGVVDGVGIGAPDDPRGVIRARLQREAMERTALRPYVALALLIKSWRFYALGEKVSNLKFSDVEEWPSVRLEQKPKGSNVTAPNIAARTVAKVMAT